MWAKKSLGQHFLKSEKNLDKIVLAGNINSKDTVLEIGPGQGVLTSKILEKAKRVIAVEKDDRLINFLKEKFVKEISENRLEVVHQDILEFNPADYKLKTVNYKLIANIPYYITGKILRKFLGGTHKPSLAVLLVQKEVAKRITSKNNKESILSLSIKVFGKPHYISTIKKNYFKPAPKVDSAILLVEEISNKIPEAVQEIFFTIVKTGFGSKRKKLISNLEKIKIKKSWKEVFEKCDIDQNIRPEDLVLEKWLCLTSYLTSNKLIGSPHDGSNGS